MEKQKKLINLRVPMDLLEEFDATWKGDYACPTRTASIIILMIQEVKKRRSQKKNDHLKD